MVNRESTLSRMWMEAEPIAAHVIVVLMLEASILLIGLATRWLKELLPAQQDRLSLVETIDTWTALALLCLFALYTLMVVGIRLARSLATDWQKKAQPIAKVPNNE